MAIFHRPWGSYKVISDTDLYKMKTLTISADQSISLQYHKHRSEIWYIISGDGEVLNYAPDTEAKAISYSVGDIFEVAQGNIHKIKAKTETVIFEVQIGTYFGEEDIIRLEDQYGRMKKNDSPKN